MNTTSLSHSIRRGRSALALLGFFVASFAAAPTSAMPGFYVGKDSAKRTAHSSQVAVMNKDGRSVVTVLADYDGPMKPFAFVVPVPGDVTQERIKTLRRDAVGRLDEMSAPRFHEFWEKDPCEPGKAEQIWERNLKASDSTNFLGINMPGTGPKKKVAKELSLRIKPDFKQGEYTFNLLSEEDSAKLPSWLSDNGYKPPDGLASAIKPYVDAKMKFLVADVDPKRLEIIAGGRSQLSAIRYWSEKPVTTIPSTLGRLNLSGAQELLVFVLDPDKRYEAKNYKTVTPPTNLEVAMKSVPGPGGLKERPGELYAAIHDRMLAKDPKAFVLEYSWPTSGCGEPCPNPPLYISELLTLGADVFEQFVSDEDKNPEPPELSDEEKKKEEKLEKAEQKQNKETREEVARRKALLSRHEYILTRLHHRYTKDTLPEDVKIGPADKHKRGGVEIPKGEKGTLPTAVIDSDRSKLQVRFNFFHPWKGQVKCEKPVPHRWGKPPRTYRGLRKIWIATDLSQKDRKEVPLDKAIKTPVPSIDIKGAAVKEETKPAPQKKEEKKGCGCRAVGGHQRSTGSAGWLVLAGLGWVVRRRRR